MSRRRFPGWGALGLLLLAAAFGVSLWRILRVERQQYGGDVAVVRLAHWQLELGYREALQEQIDAYNRLMDARFARGEIPRRVRVEQIPIGKVYAQVINTNIISQTAPDLIEMGSGFLTNGWYKAEHFVNLTPYSQQPNPWNADEHLDPSVTGELRRALPRMAWKDTFIDGMTGTFDTDLQAIYGVGTSFIAGNRMAVNLDLLQEATGSAQPPRSLGQLLEACAALRRLGERQGRDLWPIAAASHDVEFWRYLHDPFLAASQRDLDTDHDGFVSMAEVYIAVEQGRWSFADAAMRGMIEAAREMARQMPNGFTAMDRDAAMFLFTQRQSAFILCGAWDVGSIVRQAQGRFRVAFIPSVLPGPGERWGPLPPVNEASMTAGCSFGVYKLSPHVPEAIDFLRYWTSHRNNQRFNRAADWAPCIIGTTLAEDRQAFLPRIAGISAGSAWIPYTDSGQVGMTFAGQMLDVITRGADPGQVAGEVERILKDPHYGIQRTFERFDENLVDKARSSERGIAMQALLQELGSAQAVPAANYRAMVANQAQSLNGFLGEAQRRCARAGGGK